MKPIAYNQFILVAVLCAFSVPAFGDDMDSTNSPTPMLSSADFARDASLINLEEIRLGEAAQSNSTNPAVQEFGKHMVRDHSRMNERLMKIADTQRLQLPNTNTFYVPVSAPEEKAATEMMPQTPQHKLLAQQLAVQNLVSMTGTNFDQAYTREMLSGHKAAMVEFQAAASSLHNEPLQTYAKKSLRTIRDHYEMAQKLQNELVPVTNVSRSGSVNMWPAGSPSM